MRWWISGLLALSVVSGASAQTFDPYAGLSFGKSTCAEYNQMDNNGHIAIFSWLEGFIAGGVKVGRDFHLRRFDKAEQLNPIALIPVLDGACKADPSMLLGKLAANILARVLENPEFYR